MIGSVRMPEYLQPVAQHPDHPERLLLRSSDGRFFVWSGEDPGRLPEEIEPATARWLLQSSPLKGLTARLWFHRDDLPLAPEPSRVSPDRSPDGAL
jgi:hypothetical protein